VILILQLPALLLEY